MIIKSHETKLDSNRNTPLSNPAKDLQNPQKSEK